MYDRGGGVCAGERWFIGKSWRGSVTQEVHSVTLNATSMQVYCMPPATRTVT